MEYVKPSGEAFPDMRVNIGSLKLENPVMTASGTFGYAREFENLMNLHRLGAVIVKESRLIQGQAILRHEFLKLRAGCLMPLDFKTLELIVLLLKR